MAEKDYWEIYNLTGSWIKFADTKAIAFIGIIGIILTIFQKQLFCIFNLPFTNVIKIILFITMGCLLVSIIFSILCLYPRKSEPKKNAFYYKSISNNFDQKTYVEYIEGLDEESFDKQLGEQIFQLAVVCDKKYEMIKYSLIWFIIGIFFFIVLLFCFYFNFSFDLVNLFT